MDWFKSIEIAFRRFLVRLLGVFIHRSSPLSGSIDFNRCKFLFVRQDRIGDVLVSTPLFAALKETYPSAVVDILLSPNNSFVLDNDASIRKRWVYQKRFSAAWKLVFQLRAERYDFIIDLMDNPSATSTLLLALAGGRWNIGLAKANSFVYDVKIPLRSRKDVHIVDRLAELLRPFRIDVDNVKLRVRYQVSADSSEYAAQFWQSQQLNGKLVIGINISSGSETRFWGIENFNELIRSILRDYPTNPLLILFHPRDRERAKEIGSSYRDVVLSLETSSFDRFAALIQRTGLLITPDTSAVHLAAAFQIPSVVLYVQSNKELRIWEPYHTPTESLIADVDDLTTISAGSVYTALQRLLPLKASPHSPTSNSIAVQP
ncbi:MAG TPA: glycosyltransferase family 9 protein [Bacteroidota bacterium]